jgi:ATP-dependent exoDNAse (exonuclease V) alpha subunit
VEPLEGLPANHIPITVKKCNRPISVTVGKTTCGKDKRVNVYREHFPLVPSFSYTAHKSQGKTLSKVVVDLIPNNTKNKVKIEFAYVPLSRVRRLEDLTVLRPFNPNVMKAQVNQGCAAMMKEFKQRDLCKDM